MIVNKVTLIAGSAIGLASARMIASSHLANAQDIVVVVDKQTPEKSVGPAIAPITMTITATDITLPRDATLIQQTVTQKKSGKREEYQHNHRHNQMARNGMTHSRKPPAPLARKF